ncbi:hypothetical protein D3C81_1094830 [compost metagenome]
MFRQDSWWITSPLPGLTWAMIGSPGIGRQHLAKVISTPSAPLIARLRTPEEVPRLDWSPCRFFATTTLMALPRPISASRSSRVASFMRSSSCWIFSGGISASLRLPPNAWFSKRRPRPTESSRLRFFSIWRILARAFELTTKFSQAAFGRAPGAVMISTV